MKLSIEIPDAFVERLKHTARLQQTTVERLVEAAVHEFILRQSQSNRPFTLTDGSFCGNGLAPGIRPGDWYQICELIYEDRGG